MDVGRDVTINGVVYRVRQKLGNGSFGAVYGVTNADGDVFAIKVEQQDGKHSQLEYEYRLYRELGAFRGGAAGMPQVYQLAKLDNPDGKGCLALVMQRLGMDLGTLKERSPHRIIPIEQVAIILYKALQRLETLHAFGVLHRDIKPSNFVLGEGAKGDGQLYMIDLGLSKKFRDANGEHIKFKDNKTGITGTARFASRAVHRGEESSRRCDLESLLYTIVYLAKGALPWQNIKLPDDVKGGDTKAKKNYKNNKTGDLKETTSLDTLCDGLPREIYQMFQYLNTLEFADEPDYKRLLALALRLYRRVKRA